MRGELQKRYCLQHLHAANKPHMKKAVRGSGEAAAVDA